MSDNLIKTRNTALRQARTWAKQGNQYMCQVCIDHAHSYHPVSKKQVVNLQKLLNEYKGK